jgi:hypothetical protein
MFKHNFLFYPEEVIDTGKAELGKEDLIELLGEEEKEEKIDLKEEKSKEKEEESEEKKDELDELEEELETPDEEKLELVTPVRRKEILKEFPDLFKKFPYLEKAYYREQQYTELIPTIDDAKEILAKADVLDKFEADISKGNIEQALKAVKGSSEQAFNNLVDNYLPNLARVDKDAYHHVIGNIIKNTVARMLEVSDDSKNEELKEAASILNQFVFGTNKVTAPTNLSKPKSEDDTKQNELNQERQAFMREKFESTRDDLNTKVTNTLKSTIAAYIDPKDSMTDYVKKNAIRECQENLENLLLEDRRLSNILDKLWMQASKENFSRGSVDKIKSAYLSTAKTLLPSVIKKARIEALKGLGKRINESEEESDSKKGPVPAGKSTSQRVSNSGKSDRDKAKEIPANVSNRDFLMSD